MVCGYVTFSMEHVRRGIQRLRPLRIYFLIVIIVIVINCRTRAENQSVLFAREIIMYPRDAFRGNLIVSRVCYPI